MLPTGCFKSAEKQDVKVEYDVNGKPIVFLRRWLILFGYTFGALMWNFEWARYSPLTSEFALYYNTTNEFSPSQGELGVDFLTLTARIFTFVGYLLAGYLIDKYGLKMITVGAFGQSIGTWLFYFSMGNLNMVVFSRALTAMNGPLIYGSILRITSHWFPATERVFAIALAIFVSGIGGSFALLIPPLYKTSEEKLNFELKSCLADYKQEFLESNFQTNTTECIQGADDAFCCAADVDIAGINFLIALLTTINAVYCLIVVRDSPPSPPQVSGAVRASMGLVASLRHVASYSNYIWINIADFLASGVALVVYNTISRIFPASVADLAIYVSSGAMPLAIPVSFFLSWYLGKTGDYFGITSKCYYAGFVCWWLATIGLAVGGFGDYMVLIGATLSSLLYLMWQVAVFELKLEYVFHPDFALQGFVVAVDRCLINIASLTFIAAIPPERFKGDMDGRLFTFLVGGAVFVVAVLIIVFLPNKREYLRAQYEIEHSEESEDKESITDIEPVLGVTHELG